MRRAVALLLLGAAVCTAADPCPEPPDPTRAGEKALAGEWKMVAVLQGGMKIELPVEYVMRLDKGKMTMKFQGTEKSGTYKLNPNRKPSEMEMTADGKSTPAIYQVEKDKLLIASASTPGGARPKDFKGADGTVLIFQRVKK